MGIPNVDLDKINVDDVNSDEDDCETIIHVRLGVIDIKSASHLKKYKQRINAYSMASIKRVGLVLARR